MTDQASFSRHRYELPTLAVFLSLAMIELFVVHLLVAMWSPVAAWVLTALTIFGIAQIALLIHGMIRWPTLIGQAGLTVRHGRRKEIFVPFAQIAKIEDVAFRPEEKGPQAFRATVLAQPNVGIRLSSPLVHGRRRLESILMRLDDPAAFRAALSARLKDAAGEAC